MEAMTNILIRKGIFTCEDLLKEADVEEKRLQHTPKNLIDGPLPGMKFAYIPAGSFMMGSKESNNEQPVHKVTLQPFYMQTTPVTQKQWVEIMGDNPSRFKGDDRPVETVSWEDCQEFIMKLDSLNPGKNYRLPSESEWEYACRAGTTTRYCNGNSVYDLGRVAWYDKNSGEETHAVGIKSPNNWGLYDMHGNVNEWCEDKYHDNYKGAPADGSAWTDGDDDDRIFRGGTYFDEGRSYIGDQDCRSACRDGQLQYERGCDYGFRLVMDVNLENITTTEDKEY